MNPNDSIFTDVLSAEKEASLAQRFFSTLIDWIIDLCLLVACYVLIPRESYNDLIKNSSYGTFITAMAVMFIYRLLTVLLFNRTVGMMACRMKYLNEQQKELTGKEKIIAALAVRTSKIKYYRS